MVGRRIPYWNSPFLGDMLVFGGVRDYEKPSLGGGFQVFFILTPNLGEDDPIWLILFKWVETTN